MDDDFIVVSDTEEQNNNKKKYIINNLKATFTYGILIGSGIFVSFCGLIQQFIAIDNEIIQQFLEHFWFKVDWKFWSFWLFIFIVLFFYVKRDIKNKFK